MVFPNKMFGDMIDDKPDLGFQKKRKPLVKSEFEMEDRSGSGWKFKKSLKEGQNG